MIDLLCREGFVYYDGGFGTMLIASGKKPGERAELMNLEAPETVENIHRLYVEAGSDIICTNTFGACADNMAKYGRTVSEIVTAAVVIAARAAGGKAKIALDIGPIGEFMEPYGDLTYEHAYGLFKEQMTAGEKAGADIIAVETMTALEEAEAAINAAKENTSLPVFATMTFDKNGYTMMGCTIEQFIETAEKCGADAVGMNCSFSPKEMYEVGKRLARNAKIPTIVKLNAGKPDMHGNYSVTPEEFAEQMLPYAQIGIKVVGGCCGTTPEYIRILKYTLESMRSDKI